MTNRIIWRPGGVELDVSIAARPPAITRFALPGEPSTDDVALPLVEVRVAGEGNDIASSERMMGGGLSRRMQYLHHEEREHEDGTRTLAVAMRDPETSLTITTTLTAWPDLPIVRWRTQARNDGDLPAHIQLLSSIALGGISGPASDWWDEQTIGLARNSWFREAAWQHALPGDLGLDDVGLAQWRYPVSRSSFALTGRGSWSTGGNLPMGMLSAKDGSRTLLWQIENNGGWRWEIGDWAGALYLVATGPTEQAHHRTRRLAPGESFASVPAAIALAAMTEYRRRIRRPHPDNDTLPVVFNDFMNALMGDPTTEKLLPLIDAAADVGAEYFCIDAGWHAETRYWWDDLGDWRESARRFPGGLREVAEHIRARGMLPGLWLEPESVGVNSAVARELPDEAFFQRDGARVIESGRYQLDFRHPAVVERLTGIVDRLVADYGVGYLKFDDNVDVTQGTDVASDSPGDGQLVHGRAYLAWLASVLDRHPGLVIENCSAGGQRMDYALLSLHSIQSTSDNQDPIQYAAISASMPTAVTPEQGAVWAYPDHRWSRERNAFTMVNSLLGRIHLGGRLDLLDVVQAADVRDAIDVYKGIRGELCSALPFWPSGLPGWHDDMVSLGMRARTRTYISVWRRSGSATVELRLPALSGQKVHLSCLYPAGLPTESRWDGDEGVLTVALPDEPSARLFVIEADEVAVV